MAQCLSPFTKDGMSFPCGKCYPCLKRRVSGWSFRLLKEEQYCSSSYFITLTYKNEDIPITEKGFATLCKRDLQLFFKRLRKAHSKEQNQLPIKYYAVGEYGSKGMRPHYHVVLFNAHIKYISQSAETYKRLGFTLDGKHEFHDSKTWQNGHVTIGQITPASVGYCFKYIMKPTKIPQHKNDDRAKEFQLSSKGLGISYIQNPDVIAWHQADIINRYYLPLEDGKKACIPRYYKNHLSSFKQREQVFLHALENQPETLPEKVRSSYYYYSNKLESQRRDDV